MTVSRMWMAVALLLAVAPALPARAQEARKPDAPPVSAPAPKPVDPTEQQKREAARLLLLNGGKPATGTNARQVTTTSTAPAAPVGTGVAPVINATAAGNIGYNSGASSPQPVIVVQQPVDPIAVAQAEQIRVQNEAVRRQMDLQEAIALNDIERQRQFDEQQLAYGWQALDNDLSAQYQNLAYQDQGLAANQIGLQSAVTGNRQQYFAYKSFRQWDNLNRSFAVVGNSLGDLSAPVAGVVNLAMHGHEDDIDRNYEGQFNQQQSAMLSDIDASRQQQIAVREELRNNLKTRMEALKARQAALRQPQPTTTTSPAPQQPQGR